MDTIQSVTLFYLDPVSQLLRAIVKAEGGQAAYLRAIRCSMPSCKSYSQALAIGAKTLRSRIMAYCGFCDGGSGQLRPLYVLECHKAADPWTKEPNPRRLAFSYDFIRFVGAKWAPVGASNDPTDLNRHWVANVEAIYRKAVQS